ncbi:MAG: energy-coupling factor ABC transporter substrate-binding protein [Brooklawnia sp.]|jgi:cobalt/nickel transport protein
MSDKKWINWVLLAVVVAIFAVSFFLAPRPASDDEESFAGTDSVVTEVLEEGGAEPWFSPVFEAGSGELESGLFAIQAAIGAGLLGYAMGNLRGRRLGSTSGPAPAAAAPVAPTPTG